MALKRLIEATLLASLILGTAGCSGARSILRGQSPEDALPAPEVPVPVKQKKEFRLPLVTMAEPDQDSLMSWCRNSTFAPLLGNNPVWSGPGGERSAQIPTAFRRPGP